MPSAVFAARTGTEKEPKRATARVTVTSPTPNVMFAFLVLGAMGGGEIGQLTAAGSAAQVAIQRSAETKRLILVS